MTLQQVEPLLAETDASAPASVMNVAPKQLFHRHFTLEWKGEEVVEIYSEAEPEELSSSLRLVASKVTRLRLFIHSSIPAEALSLEFAAEVTSWSRPFEVAVGLVVHTPETGWRAVSPLRICDLDGDKPCQLLEAFALPSASAPRTALMLQFEHDLDLTISAAEVAVRSPQKTEHTKLLDSDRGPLLIAGAVPNAEIYDGARSLFDATLYVKAAGIGLETDANTAFIHFLSEGLDRGTRWSLHYDHHFLRRKLSELDLDVPDTPRDLLELWLTDEDAQATCPSPLFDEEHYAESYASLIPAGCSPFSHFLAVGQLQGLVPSPAIETLRKTLTFGEAQVDPELITCLLRSMPILDPEDLADLSGNASQLKKHFWRDFYVFEQELDPGMSDAEVFRHFLTEGICSGARPNALFNEEYYIWFAKEHEVFGDRVSAQLQDGACAPYLHWWVFGRPCRVVPTPLFDEQYYLSKNGVLKKHQGWLFDHYCINGVREDRLAVPFFDAKWVKSVYPFSGAQPTLVEFLMRERGEAMIPHQSVELGSLKLASSERPKLEDLGLALAKKLSRLRTPDLAEAIRRAAAIEPLIHRPHGFREANWPAIKHPAIPPFRAGREMRRNLPQATYDSVVLVPHCRMAGSARFAGIVTQALTDALSDESVLVVATDLAEFQRPDWFGDRYDLLILPHAGELTVAQRARALFDLVRGVEARRVININSKSGWHLYEQFGKQLSQETELLALLFCYDLDANGNKGGYPILAFQRCFEYLRAVALDNEPLKTELITRYQFSADLQNKLHVLKAPFGLELDLDLSDRFAQRRREQRPLRVFWAGRFDRQKRFDVMLALADLRPDIEFHIWGRPVLEDAKHDLSLSPPNVIYHGSFAHLDEVPLLSFDLFLYTAEWDGAPSGLIEVSRCGMAVVASQVGGVVDVVTPDTGWLVRAFDDPTAYAEAIDEMVANPDEVTRRAALLRKRTRKHYSPDQFTDAVGRFAKGERQ